MNWSDERSVSLSPHVAVRAVSLRTRLAPHTPSLPFLYPPVAVFQGPANWWIDTVANSLKIGTVAVSYTHLRAHETLS
jgi:hypothetical protein